MRPTSDRVELQARIARGVVAILAALRLVPPPRVVASLRTVNFPTALDKARWLDARARVDALRPGPRVSAVVGALRALPLAERALVLHAFCRDVIRYVRDPDGFEELADAETILGRLLDDCDGKGTVFVTAGLAAGLECRIRGVFRPGTSDFRHVQAETRWPGSEAFPGAGEGGWVLAELICEGVALGQGAEHARRDNAGRIITTDP